MDREAAVIREEMSQTRADLDEKLTHLEARAEQLRPRAVVRRHLPDYPLDRAIGAVLTFIGARMAWKQLQGSRRKAQGANSKAKPSLILAP
jgi:hypothetical protein